MPDPEHSSAITAPEIWNVAVPVPLRQSFAYRVDPALRPAPGMRVLVPFGRRRMTGILLDRADIGMATKPFQLKSVLEVLDESPAIPAELLSFLRRSAAYYLHPEGEVLRSALPPGMDPVERKGTLKGPRVAPSTHRRCRVTEAGLAAVETISAKAPARTAVLCAIIADGPVDIPVLSRKVTDASKHVRRLEADGLISVEKEECFTDPFADAVARDTAPTLNDEQRDAVMKITEALEGDAYRGFLLHGVTGSGKTEVYLHAVEKALAAGKGALVLVPEITLTPQLVGRYRARFGDALAVLHSGLTEKERFDQWRRLRSGTVSVAIGVRSALFAPIERPGIFIVDEEHDGSFKQERGFSYHARDMVLLRASMANAIAVLGSATPSLESFANARNGKLTLLSLTERATRGTLPTVEVVNLGIHRSGPGPQNVITGPLCAAIQETLDRREQVILFLNRRGFAPHLVCTACGQVLRCDHCAVSMTVHRRPPSISCHYCGAHKAIPAICAACHGDLCEIGSGTQKVEDIVERLFPAARVARLDRDVANARNAEAILQQLRDGEIDILVGTQMVTKGHDFPVVTLVGVLQSDVGLHMPDFRAAERTFQLLTQVAGRAGRADRRGKAIIQTFSPDHPAVLHARHHDYIAFARQELSIRQELGYPPFGRLAMIRLSSLQEGAVEDAARQLFSRIRDIHTENGGQGLEILGPSPSPLSFLQNRYRWQILLKGRGSAPIREVIGKLRTELESPPKDIRVRCDLDPVNML